MIRSKFRDAWAASRRRRQSRPVYRPAFSDIRGLPGPNAKAPPPPPRANQTSRPHAE